MKGLQDLAGETDRLRLRRIRLNDEEEVYELLSDDRVVRYMLFPLFDRERSQAFVKRANDDQLVLGIEDRAGGALIGLCGLVLGTASDEGEAWYLLRPARWGQGLATVAVSLLVDHGFTTLGLRRIWASCLPENPASARVLEKIGFQREGLRRKSLRIHGTLRDSYLYAMLAGDWQAGSTVTAHRTDRGST